MRRSVSGLIWHEWCSPHRCVNWVGVVSLQHWAAEGVEPAGWCACLWEHTLLPSLVVAVAVKADLGPGGQTTGPGAAFTETADLGPGGQTIGPGTFTEIMPGHLELFNSENLSIS